VVNIANIIVGNDFKPSSLECDVVTPNNGSDKEDSLENNVKCCWWLSALV